MKKKEIEISDYVTVHYPKYQELHFWRPRMGIEEDMSVPQLVAHLKAKFRRWGVQNA